MISFNPSNGRKLTAMSFKRIAKYYITSQMGELGKIFRAKNTQNELQINGLLTKHHIFIKMRHNLFLNSYITK